MKADFTIAQGELQPAWEQQLVGPDGCPLDLSGCTVKLRFWLLDGTGAPKERPCEIEDKYLGKVVVNWGTGDTAVAGVHECAFIVTFADGSTMRIPPRWGLILDIETAP